MISVIYFTVILEQGTAPYSATDSVNCPRGVASGRFRRFEIVLLILLQPPRSHLHHTTVVHFAQPAM